MNAIRKIFMWLTAGVAAALLHSAATAQSPLANVDLTITHVAGNVYMIQRPGGGGNIGAQIGPDGVLLVDSLVSKTEQCTLFVFDILPDIVMSYYYIQ